MMMGYLDDRFHFTLKDKLGSLFDLYVYLDGKFVKGEEAKISVFDRGLLYGDAIFEGIRAYNGHLFKLKEHVNRLFESAKCFQMEIPLSKEELMNAISKTVEMNGLRDAHVRPLVTRGIGKPGLDPAKAVIPTVIIMAYPYKHWESEKPLTLTKTYVVSRPSNNLDPKIKCTDYLHSVLAKIKANLAGADDALMLDSRGFIAECTTENIWIVKHGKLYTPTTVSALAGITRMTIGEIARELGYEVFEKDLTLQNVYTADELFLCGTGAEIQPVGTVDGRKIGSGETGQITKKIIDRYQNVVRGL